MDLNIFPDPIHPEEASDGTGSTGPCQLRVRCLVRLASDPIRARPDTCDWGRTWRRQKLLRRADRGNPGSFVPPEVGTGPEEMDLSQEGAGEAPAPHVWPARFIEHSLNRMHGLLDILGSHFWVLKSISTCAGQLPPLVRVEAK